MKTKFKRMIAFGLVLIILFTLLFSTSAYAENNSFFSLAHVANNSDTNENGVVNIEISKSYHEYLNSYKNAKMPDKEITVDANTYSSSSYVPKIKESYKGKKGKSLFTTEDGYVEWSVFAETAGFYNMSVDYFSVAGKSSPIGRTIQIDGSLPFSEARSITFYRTWADEIDANGQTIKKNFSGNDIRPTQIEKPVWIEAMVRDTIGYINEPLKFYLSKGKHTIRFISLKEPMLIRNIKLFNAALQRDYKAVEEEYKLKGYQAADGEAVKFQAEASLSKSDPMIIPVSDHSTPATEPSDPAKIRLNAIGGDKWQQNGQWVSWEFTVPKTGLYKIGIKAIQNILNGAYSNRKIYIDGKVPFTELEDVSFQYKTDWQLVTLGGEAEPYEFYFEAGKKHQIKMEVTLGSMADVLMQVAKIINDLNATYRKILVVTGPIPDINRDYQFSEIMPDVLESLKLQSKKLQEVYNQVIKGTGMNGENAQILKKLYMQAAEMADRPETISERFSSFQSNISSLGTWVMISKNQPLLIDYFVVAPKNVKMPKAAASLWENIVFSTKSFISSFFENYNSISDVNDGNAVKVWVGNGLTGGRDQAQILKTMADNYFSTTNKMKINIQLVSMGSLLPSTLAGKGPDVALTVGQSDPVNYAVRNAVVDLARFSDYNEVAKRFSESALAPLSFGKGVYGLPETQTYPMLFYRKDIMKELNLKIPQTWQDVFAMLPILQKKQLNFGLPSAVGPIGASMTTYSMLLFQNGGQFYSDDGKKSMLDNRKAIEAFKLLTSLYNDYKIPVIIDFANRFRTGSTPIGIADYSMYNQLSVFAPELEGIWDFTEIPGVRQADGTIDRSASGGVNACIILNKSKNKENAWEFIKWWTSTAAQVNFGRELESIMGTAARYPTANMEALYQIPWPKTSFDKLMAQWKWVKGIPEVPGGYYTPRYLDFAFRDVINNSYDVGESILKATKAINKEIKIKRNEFGLPN